MTIDTRAAVDPLLPANVKCQELTPFFRVDSFLPFVKLRYRAARRARIEMEWGLIAMTIAALIGI